MTGFGIGPLNYDFGNFKYNASNDKLQWMYTYFAYTNKTCNKWCPVVNTNFRQTYWYYNETTNAPGDLVFRGTSAFYPWTRPWWKTSLPYGSAFLSPAYVGAATGSTIGNLLSARQTLTVNMYDPTGTMVAVSQVTFSIENLSNVLQSVRAKSGALNSFYYALDTSGQIIALTGKNMTVDLIMFKSPVDNQLYFRKIFDIRYEDYPLINLTAAVVYNYANQNLSSSFADAQFTMEDYLFQVTSKQVFNYKYIVISGAPSADYLADTAALKSQLQDNLWSAQRTIIIVAVAIVVGMVGISLTFTHFYINLPLKAILLAMSKEFTQGLAMKFDFSSIADGSARKKSIILEIVETQDSFMSLMKTFADALQSRF
ncbi:hypothetical protein BJ742DRAFT_739130 [Cladochytrium replicatum]|nr:hypothetical protein BJ742DRAFT_739130 [Cladochytrium replicatum]